MNRLEISGQFSPTRQQLQAFLQAKGVNPEKLKLMSSWEQVRLAREYRQEMANQAISA